MPAVARGPTLALASADLERLRVRVRALAEGTCAPYRDGPGGFVIDTGHAILREVWRGF